MACGNSTTRSWGTEAAERVYSPFAPFRHLSLASNTCLDPELAEGDRMNYYRRVPGKLTWKSVKMISGLIGVQFS